MIYEDPPGSGEYVTGPTPPTGTSKWYAVSDTSDPDPIENAARERVTAAWEKAPTQNLETLMFILNTAKEDVIAYAPAEGEGDDWENNPRERFVLAQLQQAKNLWEAGEVNGNGEIGEGGFSFTPRPLDKTIKRMIRPTDGKPHVL